MLLFGVKNSLKSSIACSANRSNRYCPCGVGTMLAAKQEPMKCWPYTDGWLYIKEFAMHVLITETTPGSSVDGLYEVVSIAYDFGRSNGLGL